MLKLLRMTRAVSGALQLLFSHGVPIAAALAQAGRGTLPPRTPFASFGRNVADSSTAKVFESFIDRNRGKLVHLNSKMNPTFSRIGNRMAARNGAIDDLFVATDPCPSPKSVRDCPGSHYVISVSDDYVLEYHAGNNIINGYFTINDNAENHQGVYYVLKPVAASQVLLSR